VGPPHVMVEAVVELALHQNLRLRDVGWPEPENPPVPGGGHEPQVKLSVRVHRHAPGLVVEHDLGGRRRPGLGTVEPVVAGDGGDDAVGIDPPDRVVPRVGDEEAPVRTLLDLADLPVEDRRGGRSAVARRRSRCHTVFRVAAADAHHRRDRAPRIHVAHPAVVRVDHVVAAVRRAGGVLGEREGVRGVEHRLLGRAAIATEARLPGAGSAPDHRQVPDRPPAPVAVVEGAGVGVVAVVRAERPAAQTDLGLRIPAADPVAVALPEGHLVTGGVAGEGLDPGTAKGVELVVGGTGVDGVVHVPHGHRRLGGSLHGSTEGVEPVPGERVGEVRRRGEALAELLAGHVDPELDLLETGWRSATAQPLLRRPYARALPHKVKESHSPFIQRTREYALRRQQ